MLRININEDNVQRITNENSYEEKIERSRFIVSLRYVEQVDEAKEFINSISKKHKTANHNCWAYIIGKDGEWAHSSDNGEPSGTAGKPILNALHKYNLTNVVCVVTRYFGGIKLGIRGLIEAYSGVVERAVEFNKFEELIDFSYYIINTSYDYHNVLNHKLKQYPLEVIATKYTIEVELEIQIRTDSCSEFDFFLIDLSNQKRISYKKEEK